jgi:bifunctional non-homologous end joining protein LigD
MAAVLDRKPARRSRRRSVAAGPRRTRSRATETEPPRFVEPMKALAVEKVPAGDWVLEIKFDGYRALATIDRGAVELWSRNHKPLTADYSAITEPLSRLRCESAVLDGEIVALDENGRPRFQLLQRRRSEIHSGPIMFYLFDLLQLDGRSFLDEPIEERKRALSALLDQQSDPLRLSPVFSTTPARLLAEVKRKHLEGIIAKKSGSRYEPGLRSGAWIKCRLAHEQEFVIGGFTPPGGSRPHFGAILIGYYERGKLLYAGKVGTGFDTRTLTDLHRKFATLRAGACPFSNLPMTQKPRWGLGMTSAEMRHVSWLRPELVAQIRFAEWTEETLLRQPVYLGLRTDKPAREVVREALSA